MKLRLLIAVVLFCAAAMAGLVLLASGAVAGSRYRRRVPRARTSS